MLGKNARARNGYLAGSDRERAFDFNAALNDAGIAAIFALRGGYGTMRIAHAIDYDAFARSPKIVMGYSDLTVVLNALAARANTITFHGPVAATPWSDATREWVARALCDIQPLGTMRAATKMERAGAASGVLRGGNLTLLAHLCGTPFAVDLSDAIVFLEDVDEADYRIDRMLTQLMLARAFEHARGFLIGDVPNLEIVRERLHALKKPALSGVPVGHIEHQWVMPIGAHVTIDADTGTIAIGESAVA